MCIHKFECDNYCAVSVVLLHIKLSLLFKSANWLNLSMCTASLSKKFRNLGCVRVVF